MHGRAKASGVRRGVRSGCGAVAARGPSNSGHSFSLKFWCAQLYWGKRCRCGVGAHKQEVAHT